MHMVAREGASSNRAPSARTFPLSDLKRPPAALGLARTFSPVSSDTCCPTRHAGLVSDSGANVGAQ